MPKQQEGLACRPHLFMITATIPELSTIVDSLFSDASVSGEKKNAEITAIAMKFQSVLLKLRDYEKKFLMPGEFVNPPIFDTSGSARPAARPKSKRRGRPAKPVRKQQTHKGRLNVRKK